ncbi:MAG: MFS transporter [Acidobacteria bacterium]|nr:MFS transporter [Acidobacteriota bacterium]MBP7476839.1 MFS transporter [Pyrinomonadaceae bacterium]MBP9108989.1 MFS transporter [Pyrinomonadaceae bacterium]
MNNDQGDIIESQKQQDDGEFLAAPEESGGSATGAVIAGVGDVVKRIGRYRWTICALLFFASAINYVDRQVIAILKPTLQKEFGWTDIDYGWIIFAFSTAYALGFIFAGRFMDKFGTKIGFTVAIILWSIGAMMHAWAVGVGEFALPILTPIIDGLLSVVNAVITPLGFAPWSIVLSVSVAGFIVARFVLGLGESGNFPAAIKTTAEWFPKKERALSTGIFNAGTNVGALVTPLVVPILVSIWGWYEAFIVTGVLGFIWLAFWLVMYKRPDEHPRLSAEELAYIQSDPAEPTTKVPWGKLIRYRQTWAFALGKFLTDPIWWIYLFWVPDFLQRQHGLDLKSFGLPIAVIYIIADVGSVGGGYISSALIKRGYTINRSRKTAMLICALAVLPIVLASVTSSLWLSVILIGVAAAAHQGWSANLFTLTSDTFPKQAVGSVVGIGGMFGAIGGMVIAPLVGYILATSGSYVPIFIIAASAYLLALLIIHLLAPKLEPAAIDA